MLGTLAHIDLPGIEGIVEFPDLSEYGFGESRTVANKVMLVLRRASSPRLPSSFRSSMCRVEELGRGFCDGDGEGDLYLHETPLAAQDCSLRLIHLYGFNRLISNISSAVNTIDLPNQQRRSPSKSKQQKEKVAHFIITEEVSIEEHFKFEESIRISPLLVNLPSEILINILSRLPIQTILSCKCVNKQLLCLLSTPEFAASHLPLSTTGLLILQYCNYLTSCQVLEFEDEIGLQNSNLHSSPVRKFGLDVSMGLPNVCLGVVGSVNGLLCLRESGTGGYDALYICNPMTREYIALPRIEGNHENSDFFEYGFGVSKMSGQYKVVRYVHRHSYDSLAEPCSDIRYYECLVYTVGTRSWRKVQPGAPFRHYDLSFSLFLNGNLHGCVLDYCGSAVKFYCFDLESESFKPFPQIPPQQDGPLLAGNLGILDDCLCFLENRSEDEGISALWVMKEYGVAKSWTEILVISEVEDFTFLYEDCIYPIKAFKNGELLLNWNNLNLFYCNSVTKTCRDLDLGIQNEKGSIQAISHRLTLLSLKNFDDEFELQHHNLHYNPVIEFNLSKSIATSDVNIWIKGSVNGLICVSVSGTIGMMLGTLAHIDLPGIEGIVDFLTFLSMDLDRAVQWPTRCLGMSLGMQTITKFKTLIVLCTQLEQAFVHVLLILICMFNVRVHNRFMLGTQNVFYEVDVEVGDVDF
ncbi:F-box protein-like [Dorcoceras hygrometricum]|uniref:F-box protein-like n=1 Tax=Dorcoceras hygrometricum TaxID=472368 RepID=A0A2Z7B016_9LAMI|nr:F-box protein-like [Dorcoceras hygrometricum]